MRVNVAAAVRSFWRYAPQEAGLQRRLSELEVLVLAGQKVPHHKPAKDCRFSESSVWASELGSNCRYGHSRLTLNQEERVDLMAQRNPALLSPQGSLSVLRGRVVCPLVLAVLVRGMRAEIPRFFYAAEIAAAGMLLFFRKSAAMGFLTLRVREFALSRADSKPKTGR